MDKQNSHGIIIEIIEHALAKGNTSWAISDKFRNSKEVPHYFDFLFTPTADTQNGINTPAQDVQWKLKPESIFSYMDYENAKISQRIARWAMVIAVGSLIIAIVSLFVSVILGFG